MAKKILIVEDERILSDALIKKFTQENFVVLSAKDGQQGLSLALTDHPDLILLDIIMPVMDGMTMLRKLREDSWGKNANVILLTNLSNAITEPFSQSAHDNYLVKSNWKIEEIVEKVKKKLGIEA
jgi:two-component system alkaline phosphatase synthesis response regulator PhoP